MVVLVFLLFIFLVVTVACTALGARCEGRSAKLGYFLFASLPPLILWCAYVFLTVQFSVHVKGEIIVATGALALIELLLLLVIFGWMRKKRFWIPFAALCLCAAIAGVGICNWMWYKHEGSGAKLSESGNLLQRYDPSNPDNLLAQLEEAPNFVPSGALPRLDGATALYPVYAAFAKASYPASVWEIEDSGNLDVDVPLACSTTSTAYQKLVDGEADIIFVAAPSEEQRQYAEDQGEEMIFTPIGREAFVFFVNSRNPVEELTTEQLRGIYSGNITDWGVLGARLGSIRAFQRNGGSGSQSAMVRFMGDVPLMSPPTEQVVDGMGDIIERVSDYRNYEDAIGYSFRFYCTDMVRNDQIRLLRIDGVAPTVENIASGAYPLASEFYAVTLASNENPNVEPMLQWILSDQGQSLIEQTGYVPLLNS